MAEFKKCPPDKAYYLMDVEEGDKYLWCACGKSSTAPFCDGSHKGTGVSPVLYTAPTSKEVFFCGCGKTANAPHCDGAHKELKKK